jgi:methylglyoxal synthase
VGRLTGNAGVCLSTLGPGATNLLTGVADANLDKAPLVAITGQGGLERLHKESHPPLDVVDTFEPVTKWNAQISDPAIVHEAVLSTFDLVATGTTGERIAEETGLAVERKESGLIGGDTQIGAEVVEGRVDGVVFLRDPLTAQPHEPDITALLRLCDVHDTPMATTRSAAAYLLDGLAADADVEIT